MDLARITRLARRRYRQCIGHSNIKGITVPIVCYLTERDYRQVCDDELIFYEHWAMLALFAEMLSKRGGVIVFMPLVPADFFLWLEKNKFKNCYESRSKYTIWLLSGTVNGISGQFDRP